MTYLGPEEEKAAVVAGSSDADVDRIFKPQDIVDAQRLIHERVGIDEAALDYIVALNAATRQRKEVRAGASTRATVLFSQAVKARAFLMERECACVEDVACLAHPILRHRLVMNPDSRNFGYTSDNLIDDLLRKVRPA